MRLTRAAAALIALAVVAGEAGCAGQDGVMRVVDGRVVEGPFVAPEAYAAFLRGALAEERGDARAALAAYAEAALYDAEDPEIWSRIARARCAIDARDPGVEASIRRALAIDAEYSQALAVRAECALARGDAAAAEQAARAALAVDRRSTELELLLARATGARGGEALRDRLVALTLVHGESVAAWDALAAWARAHDDVALYARALAEIGRRAPLRRLAIADAAALLAGDGDVLAARSLAAALVDAASADGVAAVASPLVARLAVDEAIVRGDVDRTRLRATRTHLGLERAAARAVLLGAAPMARSLAAPVAAADPHARGARMVLAAVASLDGASDGLASFTVGVGDAVPAECLFALAVAVARTVSDDAAKGVAAAPHDATVQGDATVTAVAVELAARGVLPAESLAPEAAVELAARKGEAPPAAPPGSIDARHELLALALTTPDAPRAAALAKRLARVRDRDAIVAVACARVDLARGADTDAARLLAGAPADPLVAAAALDVAARRGDGATAARARATLSAVARTAAERARTAQ